MRGQFLNFSFGFTCLFHFSCYLFQRLSIHQRLGLGKEVGKQFHMVIAYWIMGNGRSDKVTGNQLRSLMDQLVKCMLPVGSGLTPDDRAGSVVHFFALSADIFTVTFHIALLKVSRKSVQVLIVRQYSLR